MVKKCLHLLIVIFTIYSIVVIDSSIIMQMEDTEESNCEAEWAEVEAMASKPPPAAPNDVNGSSPEAQFHHLDKVLLLQHLREVKTERIVKGKAFFEVLHKVGGVKSNPEEQDYLILDFKPD
jgi:hypothetical protein